MAWPFNIKVIFAAFKIAMGYARFAMHVFASKIIFDCVNLDILMFIIIFLINDDSVSFMFKGRSQGEN